MEDDRFSTMIVCLPGYYRGSQYVFLISIFRASGEAILGTQRYLEARFSTIAVYHPPVFLLVEDDRVSTIIVCLPGYYRGSQYVFLISFFRASGRRVEEIL